jgi:hypothetical protein
MSAMSVIETITVGSGGAATLSWTNIPQTFDDLLIVSSLRGNILGGILLNSSNANTVSRHLFGSGSSVSSAAYLSFSYNIFKTVNRGADTSNTFGSSSIYIPSYKSSATKSLSIDSVRENNATSADQWITAAIWANSAAINAVSITSLDSNVNASGVFEQHSTATLYGITRGSDGIVTTS